MAVDVQKPQMNHGNLQQRGHLGGRDYGHALRWLRDPSGRIGASMKLGRETAFAKAVPEATVPGT